MSLRALLINYEFPPLGGGAGNATANLARCLARRDVDVLVLTSRWRNLPTEERRDGYTIRRVPVLRRRADRCSPAEMLTFIAAGLAPAIALGRSWRPDVSLAFFGLPSGPLALELRRVFGIPYIVSLRGGDVPGFTGQELRVYHRLARPMIRAIWARSAGLVANSDGLADLARQTWPNAPIQVIPNGVDGDFFQPPTRVRPATPLRLLCVGRLVRQKGITYLLEALKQCETSTTLRVVGDGPEGPSLKRQAGAAGLDQRVEFVGWASRSELPAHYQWADVFVLPSFEEGMPNVILEAMASGLPIIATDVYGNHGLVEPG
ncbi:MAG: glycosyltransferase, partial [Candidatus Dormibacteraceae bacterium]